MTRQPDAVWEVTAEGQAARKRDPFRQTFADREAATAYARTMRAAGYTAAISEPIRISKTLAAAVKTAAQWFDDESLAPGSAKTLDRWQ